MDEIPLQKIINAAESWKRFWQDELQSIYLYGSAARGDWSPKSSDINLLLLLTDDDHYARWQDAAELSRRKIKRGFAAPLVLTAEYLKSSLDVFPIEFLDIKLFHKTLSGDDIFEEIEIAKDSLRIQIEEEIKGKWVQLRQATLERGRNTAEMRNLLAMTVPTWITVFQALIYLQEREVPTKKRDVLETGAEIAGLDPDLFLTLEHMRRTKSSLNKPRAWALILDTLRQIDLLAGFIDKYNA